MNRRIAIKEYVIEKLTDANLVNGSIFSCRRYPLMSEELPAIAVNVDHEQSEMSSQNGQLVKKTAQLSIEVIADARDDEVDQTIDELTAKIETLFHSDESFGNQINHAVLKNTELSYMREGETNLGIGRMNYDVTYYASPDDLQEDYSKFKSATLTLKQRKAS